MRAAEGRVAVSVVRTAAGREGRRFVAHRSEGLLVVAGIHCVAQIDARGSPQRREVRGPLKVNKHRHVAARVGLAQ